MGEMVLNQFPSESRARSAAATALTTPLDVVEITSLQAA